MHFALLAIGLKPGAPLTYNESTNKWIPPRGAPLHIDVEYGKGGKTVITPAYRLIRDVKTKKEPAAFAWVFCGSRVMPDGKYAADVTGYLLTVCNFDLTVIDVPALVSSSNETLEWERDPTTTPKAGTTVWLVISAAGPGDPTKAQNRGPMPTTQRRPRRCRPLRPVTPPISPTAVPDTANAPRRGSALGLALAMLAASAVLAGICWLTAGQTLFLFLGPPALLCIFIPQIASVLGRAKHRWAVWLLATLGTAIIWYSALPDIPGINARQVGQCVIVLAALDVIADRGNRRAALVGHSPDRRRGVGYDHFPRVAHLADLAQRASCGTIWRNDGELACISPSALCHQRYTPQL